MCPDENVSGQEVSQGSVARRPGQHVNGLAPTRCPDEMPQRLAALLLKSILRRCLTFERTCASMLLRKPLQTIDVSVLRKWYGRAVHRLGSPARAGHESMPERVAQRPADAPLRAAASSSHVTERRLAKFRQNVARFRLYRLRFCKKICVLQHFSKSTTLSS